MNALTDLQRSLFLDVNSFARHTPLLHEPFRLFARYGIVLFALMLLASWWQARGARDLRLVAAALWAPVAALLALAINQPLGRAVHEARPYTVFPHALVLVTRTTDFSFPSDHAVMAGAVAAGVLLARRRWAWAAVAAALVMAFTRVYVGAHFPLDVVAGLLLGAAVTAIGFVAVRPVLVRLLEALSRTRLRVLVARGRLRTAETSGV